MPDPAQTQPSPGESGTGEGSLRGSFIAMITPVAALAAAWVAGEATKIMPGINLDPGQIVAFMIAVVGAVISASLKWLQGWQLHEQRVSENLAAPVKPDTN
ncbi:MAG: hypothetical protein QOJ38_961 [Solirubrobacterales bacterium]|jgi:hypothetical protein|nr:hypothetical protein [Solirubrobacterales bacterium]